MSPRLVRIFALAATLGLLTESSVSAQAPPPPASAERGSAPVILTGADLPDWSRTAATIVCMPWPYGALVGERNAHSGTAFVPPDLRTGVATSQIVAFRWD